MESGPLLNKNEHDLEGGEGVKTFTDPSTATPWRLYLILLCPVTLAISLFVSGLIYDSISLLSEGMHSMADVFAYSANIYLYYMSQKEVDTRRPFGHTRASTLGGFFTGVFLICASLFIVLSAIEDLLSGDADIDPTVMLSLGIASVVINGAAAILFSGRGSHDGHNHHNNVNLGGIMLHLLADCLSGMVLIVTSLLLHSPGWWTAYLDPIASIVIALIIIGLAIPLITKSSSLLLNTAPHQVDRKGVLHDLLQIDMNLEIRDSNLRIWAIDERTFACQVRMIYHQFDEPSCNDVDNIYARMAPIPFNAHDHNSLVQRAKLVLSSHGISNLHVEVLYGNGASPGATEATTKMSPQDAQQALIRQETDESSTLCIGDPTKKYFYDVEKPIPVHYGLDM